MARRSAPPPVTLSGPNPFARKQWLAKLSTFIGERLRGEAQWQAWELISKAQTGMLDRPEQRALDRLDVAMRGISYRPGAG